MPSERLYIDDMLAAIAKIERFTGSLSYEAFSKDELVQDAVIRNLEVIGEAAKKLPPEAKRRAPEIAWPKIAGLRDILIHAYFGIDLRIVWDIVESKLPELKAALQRISRPE